MIRIGKMIYATQEEKDRHDRLRRECPQNLGHTIPGPCGYGDPGCAENKACWYWEAVSEASRKATEEEMTNKKEGSDETASA